MKEFERTDTLFIRCAPELKIAIEYLRSKWGIDSVADIIHDAIARQLRTANINADIFGPTVPMSEDALRTFCEKLGQREHRAEKKKRLSKFEREQLKKHKTLMQ